MPSTESEIRALLDLRSEAMRAKDLERLMSLYSPDVIYFDVVPPLQYVGSAALRARFSQWFDGFEGPIGQELHDVNIAVSGDTAVASMLIRSVVTPNKGLEVERWLRTTDGCRRSNNTWLITHEHVSLPVDLVSGTIATNLTP
jgi:uncharacterized protein (TIGR02246 family)